MRQFSLTVVFSVCFLSTASAQYPPRREHTPPSPPPIKKADKGLLEAEWLQAIAMTNYFIKSYTPDMDWQYVDTFDSNAEAREFLDGLLELIGDNYVGDVRKVTVLPRPLQ
jgi:hypothetical protein